MYEKIHRTMTVAQIIKSEKFTDEKKGNTRFKRIQSS